MSLLLSVRGRLVDNNLTITRTRYEERVHEQLFPLLLELQQEAAQENFLSSSSSSQSMPPPSYNGAQLSHSVIASGAKQSLFSAEIASSLTLLVMIAVP